MIAKQSTCHWVFEIFIIKSCCFYKGLFCDAIISISTWFSFALYACTLFAYWHIDFLSEPDPTCLKFSCHLIVCTWILALLYLSCFHIITTKKETGLQSIYLFIPVIKPILILYQSCLICSSVLIMFLHLINKWKTISMHHMKATLDINSIVKILLEFKLWSWLM